MIKEEILALDLGTTKFCMASLRQRRDTSGMEFSHVTSEAKGMKRGMVANISDAQDVLLPLVETAERTFCRDVRKVVVGVAGNHLRGHNISVSMDIEEREIKPQHLSRLYELAQTTIKHPEREMLHGIPISYSIDSRAATENPIGLSGRHLQGQFFFIDADRLYLKDIIKLCNQSGLEVSSLYAEPFASASVCVDDTLKDIGVAVADIGGGTTDGIVFKNGKPEKLFTINIGGHLMTQDLAIGLGIPLKSAEWLKNQIGLQLFNPGLLAATPFSLPNIDASKMQGVLGARVLELARLLASELIPYKGQLGGGLVLTGGGSGLKGLESILSNAFSIPVQKVEPQLPIEPASYSASILPDIAHSRLATVYGLLNLEYGKRLSDKQQRRNSLGYRYLSNFFNWIKELS